MGGGGGFCGGNGDGPATTGQAGASRSSGADNYNTFQQASFLPPWQASIPAGRNSPDVVGAVNQAASSTGLNPSAFAGMFGLESNWDPRSVLGSQYGVAQMSPDMWGDYGGNFGGLSWDQYRTGTAPQQIGAYIDWLNRSNNLNKGNLGVTSQSPELQAAILQAIQFAPNPMDWRTALAGGNMSMPVTASRQADELGNLSIGAMEEAYRNRMAGW